MQDMATGGGPGFPVLSERAFLACCLLDQGVFDRERAAGRSGEIFFVPQHRVVWELFGELRGSGLELDLVSVANRAVEKGAGLEMAWLAELSGAVETAARAGQFLGEVLAGWRLRELRRRAGELASVAQEGTCFEDLRPEVEAALTGLGRLSLDEREESLADVMDRVIGDVSAELSGNKRWSNHLLTGLKLFDARFGAIDVLNEDFLVPVLAGPSIGKSAFTRQVAYHNVAKRGKRGCVFLLETSRPMFLKSMAGQAAKVNLQKLKEEFGLYPEKERDFANALVELKDCFVDRSLFVYDSHFTIEEIESRARHVASQCGGLDFIVVDYIQLVGSAGRFGNREQEVAHISRRLKMLAKDLLTTVFAPSQVSRESRKADKAPGLTDGRESGAIEQDGDRVLALHRPNTYRVRDKNGQWTDIDQTDNRVIYHVDIHQLKMRNGPVGHASFLMNRTWTLFEDYPNVGEDGSLKRKGEY